MNEQDTLFFARPRATKWMRPGMMSSDDVEWYTPVPIRDAVIAALGAVDLDPCADPGHLFPATHHYTEAENGLALPWIGRVYMNPPYGRTIGQWTTKLRDELDAGRATAAIALLPARTDTGWWHDLGGAETCMIRGRLQFGGYKGRAPFPSAAIYLGRDPEPFRTAFGPLGMLYVPARREASH